MAAAINPRVASGITGLFGKPERADCRLVFVLDPSPPAPQSQPAHGKGGSARKRASGARALQPCGEPLPAHSFVLDYASDKISVQLEGLEARGAPAGPAKKKTRSSAAAEKQLPEVQLVLGSEKELPAALAAVKFAYTGVVEAGSIREVLQVRRQAACLQMGGCEQACVAAVKGMLAPGWSSASRGNCAAGGAGTSAGASSGGGVVTQKAPPPVLELYSCTELWPDPAEDAAFAALLTEAKLQLVAHFGDALAVLNNKELYVQMRALPAVGLEALLESDDFGTDSESSVVLMLAEWMADNHDSTDEDTRRRLCRQLRLVQCSRVYLSGVLPVLAARYEEDPFDPDAWLPVTAAEATCLLTYSLVPEAERKAMAGEGQTSGPCGGMEGWPPAWRSAQPRRQCLPAPAGRSFSFKASLADLEWAFGDLEEADKGFLQLSLGGALDPHHIVSMGLEWSFEVTWSPGDAKAGLYSFPQVPSVLHTSEQPSEAVMTLTEKLLCKAVVALSCMRLSVSGADGQVVLAETLGPDDFARVGSGRGWPDALDLEEPVATNQPSSSSSSSGGGSGTVARWAPYLQGGTCLIGSVTLLPPSRR
ncbi:hypothetical protein HYH02_007461 [Chlamydomonas schloesseri]|uniref:BACK domain-containing protein n=1 Tax=Chlamydomonas schloesseri TaxID=2026947 RepID=A0A835WHB9_9CHLO|nr:hypothetical protein HYH02_007461 [Chlamydomonas schloesseri]|eukprot:KAG2447537.1 hypothetical protein HYH02_007461 [Chlamydomonas schloesseri]